MIAAATAGGFEQDKYSMLNKLKVNNWISELRISKE